MSLTVKGWLVVACMASIFCWILAHTDKRELNQKICALAIGWAIAALLSAIMGGWQFLGLAQHAQSWVAASPNHEVYANLRQRNQLASLLMMGVTIFLCFFQINKGAWRAAMWVSMTLVLFCLAATASRTGFVQLMAVSCMCFGMRRLLPRYTLHHVTGVLCVYTIALLTLPLISKSLGVESTNLLARLDDPNSFSRLALWSNVLELIAQQPWTGHGWRSLAYAHYSTEFSGDRFMEMLDNAHNLPLHLAVELGLPVALVFCGLVIWGIVKATPWRESRPDRLMAWGILLVIGIHSMLEYPLWYGPFFFAALLCMMILLQDTLRLFIQKCSIAGIKYAQYAIKSVAIGLLVFTAFAAFDYHRVSQIYLQPEERSSWYAEDALGAAQKSVLFQSHAKFAELVITPLSRASAPRVLELSSELVVWSPEPRVIEKLIESAVMMQLDDLAAFHLKRYRVAYPQAYSQWAARSGLQPS